jgi:DNA-binding response OmpR family regulator
MAHILLIEPDRILAETYKTALETAGHSVVPVNGAQAAIISADQQLPDVVVLELQLIEHSGIEFLYEFRSYSEWQHIPVIIQTQVPLGEFADNWRLLREQLGVTAYLYKPQTTLGALRKQINETMPVAT